MTPSFIYPNHGAGSACGKNISKKTKDTLGNQKKTNYALNPKLSESEFKGITSVWISTPPHNTFQVMFY